MTVMRDRNETGAYQIIVESNPLRRGATAHLPSSAGVLGKVPIKATLPILVLHTLASPTAGIIALRCYPDIHKRRTKIETLLER